MDLFVLRKTSGVMKTCVFSSVLARRVKSSNKALIFLNLTDFKFNDGYVTIVDIVFIYLISLFVAVTLNSSSRNNRERSSIEFSVFSRDDGGMQEFTSWHHRQRCCVLDAGGSFGQCPFDSSIEERSHLPNWNKRRQV